MSMYDEAGEEVTEKYEKELSKVIRKAEAIFDKGKSATISDVQAKEFGICSQCKQFAFAEGEFTVVFAKCEWFQKDMTQKNPIFNCSMFEDKGQLSLFEMKQIAIPIDIPKPKMGFARKEEVTVNEKEQDESRDKDASA